MHWGFKFRELCVTIFHMTSEYDRVPAPLKEKVPVFADRPKVIMLAGPTSVGKTRMGIHLARVLGGEVVSADSMQVYRGMDIGTAKASAEELKSVPHHLIDIRNVKESFNVVDFYHEALAAVKSILARDRVPIVVGGTGFYMHALIYGPPKGPPASKAIRKKLQADIDKFGPEPLYEKLKQIDPEYAAKITKGDKQKIIRALEIIMQTKQPVSALVQNEMPSPEYNFRCWFMCRPKEPLYTQIEMRCDEMIANGFIDEVKRLKEGGIESNLSASQSIGYRQCLEYLEKGARAEDFETFVSEFKKASRRYAKRQFTWFRKQPLFRWIDVDVLGVERCAELILRDFEST